MTLIFHQNEIERRIFTLRTVQVLLDKDLAEMYDVETKVLNQAVKRNIDRFPLSFRFQLTELEFAEYQKSQIMSLNLKSQIVTSSEHGGRRYLPYAFTEQGVAMLSAVLRSETAVKISVQIINAFVEMRKLIAGNIEMLQRFNKIELKQTESDQKFEQIFKALDSRQSLPDKGIFFDGQVFDAYIFVANIIKNAENNIILVDNYIDETVLTLLTKRKPNVKVTVYTKQINKQLALDLQKHNAQYPEIIVKTLSESHDRFLITDNKELFHLGASLKDLGKKWFAFSKINSIINEVLAKLL